MEKQKRLEQSGSLPMGGLTRLILALVGITMSFSVIAELNWQVMGTERGVEIHQTRTSSGTIRLAFKNLNRYAVEVDVDEALIWCGSHIAGRGERQETYVNEFVLDPGESYASPGWNHYSCDKRSYNLELRGVKVFRH